MPIPVGLAPRLSPPGRPSWADRMAQAYGPHPGKPTDGPAPRSGRAGGASASLDGDQPGGAGLADELGDGELLRLHLEELVRLRRARQLRRQVPVPARVARSAVQRGEDDTALVGEEQPHGAVGPAGARRIEAAAHPDVLLP